MYAIESHALVAMHANHSFFCSLAPDWAAVLARVYTLGEGTD